MERYEPDELAPDPIAPGVLETLNAELQEADECSQDLKLKYEQPDVTGLSKREQDVRFDMDTDSEDDLEEFDVRYERCGDEGPPRFELLKDLWGKKGSAALGRR